MKRANPPSKDCKFCISYKEDTENIHVDVKFDSIQAMEQVLLDSLRSMEEDQKKTISLMLFSVSGHVLKEMFNSENFNSEALKNLTNEYQKVISNINKFNAN